VLLITDILWAILLLLFFAGCLAYLFNRHLGLALLQRSAIILGVVLIGPSFVMIALAAIPPAVLVLLTAIASVGAYFYVTSRSKSTTQHQNHRVSHAERQPRLPQEHREDE
jgi:predicted tellurium resistance membrane protein TerC